MTTLKQSECADAIASLKSMIRPGATVYTVIRSVAKSGMSRTMSVFIVKDGELQNITWYVGKVLDYPVRDVDGHRAIRVNGAGMDMGFHVVYSLSRVMFTPK